MEQKCPIYTYLFDPNSLRETEIIPFAARIKLRAHKQIHAFNSEAIRKCRPQPLLLLFAHHISLSPTAHISHPDLSIFFFVARTSLGPSFM